MSLGARRLHSVKRRLITLASDTDALHHSCLFVVQSDKSVVARRNDQHSRRVCSPIRVICVIRGPSGFIRVYSCTFVVKEKECFGEGAETHTRAACAPQSIIRLIPVTTRLWRVASKTAHSAVATTTSVPSA